MDKEKLITIIVGLLVGIGLAGIYFFSQKFLLGQAKSNKVILAPSQNQSATGTAVLNPTLSLDLPQDSTSTTSSPIIVSGHALPQSLLIIYGNAEEKIATADGQGSFSTTLKLEDGDNVLSVTSLTSQGVLNQSVKRTVTLEITPAETTAP